MSEDHPNLPAVPAESGTEPSRGQPLYADVTPPGSRKPVLPQWAGSREALRHSARRAGGHAWHFGRFHAVRSPMYLSVLVFWAIVGVAVLLVKWARWWLFPVPLEVWQDSVSDGHRAWHRTHAVHKQTTLTRGIISVATLFVLAVAVEQAAIRAGAVP